MQLPLCFTATLRTASKQCLAKGDMFPRASRLTPNRVRNCEQLVLEIPCTAFNSSLQVEGWVSVEGPVAEGLGAIFLPFRCFGLVGRSSCHQCFRITALAKAHSGSTTDTGIRSRPNPTPEGQTLLSTRITSGRLAPSLPRKNSGPIS